MKKTILNVFILGIAFMPVQSFAEGSLDSILEKKSETQSKKSEHKKKSRRRKVHMCNDCGKPETQCECEGHGDNKEESSSSDEQN